MVRLKLVGRAWTRDKEISDLPGMETFTGKVRVNRRFFNGEFDSGSERTLAAWIRHASQTIIRG